MAEPAASLAFAAEPAALPGLAAWTQAMVERLSLSSQRAYALELCIEEMVANILLHGQRPGQAVQVRVTITADPLRLIVEDDGPGFDPTLQPEAEMAADLEGAAIGGRGLALVRRFSVVMGYRREAGCNRVEIGLE
jgi:anti-sigma regulatory factor (Ser/Thr protein kinase)